MSRKGAEKFDKRALAEVVNLLLDSIYDAKNDVHLSSGVVSEEQDKVWVTVDEGIKWEKDFLITIEEVELYE